MAQEIPEDGVCVNPDFTSSKSNFDRVPYPDPEFHDFDKYKCSRFAVGQIWAMYDDLDAMPRFYARIETVSSTGFKVQFTWLEYDPVSKADVDWYNEELPVGCGNFMLGTTEDSDDIHMFSHLMPWTKGPKTQRYDIYPQVNEIWALYRTWEAKWKLADLKNCLEKGEYDLVEVIYRSDSMIAVIVLEKVDGFRAVFRPKRNNGILATMEIHKNKFLKFSHRILSFRLTEARGGKLRDCWELDPASVPDVLCSKTS